MAQQSLLRRLSSLVFIFAIVSVLSFSDPQSVNSQAVLSGNDIQSSPNWNALLAEAQQKGAVKIFVGFVLDPPYQQEASLDTSEIMEQRETIKRIRNQIRDALEGTDYETIVGYYFIPVMALDVDDQALLRLSTLPNVEYIERRDIYEPILDYSVPRINADDLHNFGVGGSGYTIAILDSGIQASHPTFSSRVVSEACYSKDDIISIDTLCPDGSTSQTGPGSASATTSACLSSTGDYDLNGNICYHGTHVAGIAAGNDSTYRGVAPEANIIAIQVFYRENEVLGVGCEGTGPCIYADEADVISGLQRVYSLRYSYNIVSVNLSLGSGGYTSSCDSQKPSYYNAVQNLVNVGIDVIAATGNNGYTDKICSPSCLSNVVSVAATYSWSDSTYANNNIASMLDLFAPGYAIESAVPNNSWAVRTGTSMASPHVAGAWVLMQQIDPSATKSQILNAFKNTGVSVTQHGITRKRIDVLAAGQYLDSTPPGVPSLQSPANGSATNDTTPTLSWYSSSGAVLYDYEVATDTGFSNVVEIGQVTGLNTTVGFLPDDWYYWHVRAIDHVGNTSNWSSYRSFKVDTVAPDPPVLYAPANNSSTNNSTPTFDWANMSGATSYVLQVDNSSSFSSPEIDTTTTSSQHTPSSSLGDGKYYWRVKSRDDVPNESNWSSVWNVTIDTTGPSAPVLLYPSDNSTTSDTTPTFEWSWPSSSVEFQIQIDDSTSFLSPVRDATVSTDQYTPSALAYDTYWWRVRASDALGNLGNWSSVYQVTISCPTPGTPNLSLPSNGSSTCDTTPYFDWSSVSEATSYRIQVDDSSGFTSPAINTTTSGSYYTPGSPLSPGTYYWRVQGINTCGDGTWSSVWTFTVLATPSAPGLSLPANGSSTCDTTPYFDWSAVSGATSYRVQVDDSSSFTSPAVNTTTSSSDYTPGSPLSPGTYYWRVQGINTCGDGTWSSVWSFTILGTPSSPSLASPSNGSTVGDSTPTFTWGIVTEATSYHIQVDNNADFSSPAVDTTTSNTSHTPISALPDGTYYWRVQATNSCGTGPWSTTWQFTVDTVCETPATPGLSVPSNGSSTCDTTPYFDWSAVSGATSYRVQVDDSSSFTSPAVNTTTSSSDYTPGSPLSPGTYYWRVQGINTCGDGTWSSVWSFTILGTPSSPSLASPSNGSTVGDSTPTFTWSSVAEATSYHIQVDNNADFSSPAVDTTTSNTSHTPTSALPDGTYYWRVQASNTCGTGPWSATWQITIDTVCAPPPAPGLLLPPDDSSTSDTTPYFDWSAVSGATSYQIQVDNDADFSSPAFDQTTSSTSFTPASPMPEDTYHWRVRASNACGPGSWSAVWDLTIGSGTTAQIQLQAGWTLMSTPISPTLTLRAEDLCVAIIDQGGSAVEVDRWYYGGWDPHICGLSFNNFEIEPGSAYFVRATSASIWTISGASISLPRTYSLSSGWNSISIPPAALPMTAEELAVAINAQGGACVEVDRWYASGWDPHIVGLPFNDFDIESGKGYMIKCQQASTFVLNVP